MGVTYPARIVTDLKG